MTKYTDERSNFGADGPFFRIIREGLEGLVDGEDYFDLLADDVVLEYVVSVPGYPTRVEGRQQVLDLYRGYDDYMTVHTANSLRVYRDLEAAVVVLEYEVHGRSAQTGRPYNNRFVSIITIKNRKVARWRDYLDPIAIFDAAGWPDELHLRTEHESRLITASPMLLSPDRPGSHNLHRFDIVHSRRVLKGTLDWTTRECAIPSRPTAGACWSSPHSMSALGLETRQSVRPTWVPVL